MNVSYQISPVNFPLLMYIITHLRNIDRYYSVLFVCFFHNFFVQMMTSNCYEILSVMTISFVTLKIILIECFCIQNFEVEACWHKNKQILKQHQYIFFVCLLFLHIFCQIHFIPSHTHIQGDPKKTEPIYF